MSFTDQKPRIATEEDLKFHWGGSSKGERFRCYMCGHKFEIDDYWRWVFGKGVTFQNDGKTWGVCNVIVCKNCDGDDVLERWKKQNEEACTRYEEVCTRFWWFTKE